MSHMVKVTNIKMHDTAVLQTAVNRLEAEGKATALGTGTFDFYGGHEQGLGVRLKGWQYPVVVKEDGTLVYDNFNGRWGSQDALDEFMQVYSAEAAKNAAIMQGMQVMETVDGDTGDILLTCTE